MNLRPGAPSDWAAALTSFSFQPLNPDLSEPNVFRLLMHLLSDIGLREVPDFDWLADADSVLCIRCSSAPMLTTIVSNMLSVDFCAFVMFLKAASGPLAFSMGAADGRSALSAPTNAWPRIVWLG